MNLELIVQDLYQPSTIDETTWIELVSILVADTRIGLTTSSEL